MKRLMLVCVLFLSVIIACAASESESNTYDTWFAALGENGLYGYINRQGQWMIEPQYVLADLYFTGEYIRVGMDEPSVGKQQGVIDRLGNWVLPPEYRLYAMDYMGEKGEPGEGLLVVTPSGSCLPQGYFDLDSGYFSGLKWHSIFPRYTDSSLIAVFPGEESSAGYVDRQNGALVLPDIYASADPKLFHEGVVLTAYEDWEQYENCYSDFFLMDETGRIIPFPDGIVGEEGDVSCGRVPVRNQDGLIGFADLQGNMLIEPQYAFSWGFAEDRDVVVFPEGDSGVIDLYGNILIRGFSHVDSPWYQNGIITAEKDGEYACYGLDGQRIDTLPPYCMAVENDLYWSPVTGTGYNVVWCLMDHDGHQLSVPCRLTYHAEEYRQFFSDGLQPVGNDKGKCGYINTQGAIAIDFIYDRAEPFFDGMALVEMHGHKAWIDGDGTVVWEEE